MIVKPSKPDGITRRWGFPRRLAEGVSQPPWSWRAGALAVVIWYWGFEALGQASMRFLPGGRDAALWPSLFAHVPMLCCLAFLARESGTTVGALFGLNRARIGPSLVSALLLFVSWTPNSSRSAYPLSSSPPSDWTLSARALGLGATDTPNRRIPALAKALKSASQA
jgi:hypothetical protein